MIRVIRLLLISAVLIANLASAAELTEQQRVALQTAQNFITAFEQRDAEKALAYIREDTVLECLIRCFLERESMPPAE